MSDKEKQTVADTGIIDTCFFCYKAREAGIPAIGLHVINSYKPCARCAEILRNHVALMGVSETPLFENQAGILTGGKNYFPTGRLLVLTNEQTTKIFDHHMTQNLISTKGAMIDDRALAEIQTRIDNDAPSTTPKTESNSAEDDDIEPKTTEEELD